MRRLRQGRKLFSLCTALALVAGASLAPVAHAAKSAAASKSSAPSSNAKSRRTLHQFTGVVTALDKTSITVEKGGKKPRTLVFTKHDEMRTTGEVERDARVTVYYREEGGKAVAHRVVVRPEKTGAGSR